MELTQEQPTPREYLEEYYRNNIDVHINYLLLLNNSNQIEEISDQSFRVILENIRTELHKEVSTYETRPGVIDADGKIKRAITEKLCLAKLYKTSKMVGKDLNQVDTTDIAIIKTLVDYIKRMLHIAKDSKACATANATIKSLKANLPVGTIELKGVSPYESVKFLADFGISYSKDTPFAKFNYDVLSSFYVIISMIKYENYDIGTDDIDYLFEQMSDLLTPGNIEVLSRVLASISSNIAMINKEQSERKRLARVEKNI